MSAIRDREENIGFTPGVGQDNSIERDAAIGEQEKGERRPPAHNDLDSTAWSGADDPASPKNWSNKRKWLNITVLSLLTVVTPLGSSMFAPGIPSIMAEFHETSPNAATFILSIYVLGFVFGPILIAPLSETYGRRKLYIWGNILFTIFSVGTALSNSMGMLLGFRFSMGFAGVVPITIGSGSIADMMALEMRGRAISIWALGPLLGPCIGPVAGGYLIRAKGWRWVYWLISIISGVLIPISTFLLDETFAPVILQRRNASLPQDTTNSAVPNRSTPRPVDTLKFRAAALRPTKLLFLAPLVTLSALYIAISYGILYLLIATFSFVYPQQYGFDEGTSGLAFIPAGIGMILGVIGIGQVTDLMVKRNKLRGVVHQPKFRLVPIITIPCGLALPCGLFIYGWTTYHTVHWIVPMISVSIMCMGLMTVNSCIQNYLLDTYPRYAASVSAALTILRSFVAALLPLSGLQMYEAMGLGWANSLLGFVALVLIVIPLILYKFGELIKTWHVPKL
ncbi:major facilitator superfamily domain-containing protein [Fusarium oxysporum]|nr:major facilitator superfamily domain-containing protein [Fusarium oxysporum]